MSDLITRLEAATGPDRELDARICIALGLSKGNVMAGVDGWCINSENNPNPYKSPAYTASIDAALTLVPEGWRMAALCQRDPWFCRLETDDFESVTWGKGSDWITEVTSGSQATANAPTPALAICSAALGAALSEPMP